MIETRSASTALNKHKGLQQFFRWLLDDEQAIDRNPMDRVRQPKTPTKLVPVMREDDTAKVLEACRGKGFVGLRDEALIRLYANTGARLSEVGNLLVDRRGHEHRVGALPRQGRQGPAGAVRAEDGPGVEPLPAGPGQAQGRRAAATVAGRPRRGTLAPNGIKIRLKRLGQAAGVADVHAHRWRHSFAHEWKLAGATPAT